MAYPGQNNQQQRAPLLGSGAPAPGGRYNYPPQGQPRYPQQQQQHQQFRQPQRPQPGGAYPPQPPRGYSPQPGAPGGPPFPARGYAPRSSQQGFQLQQTPQPRGPPPQRYPPQPASHPGGYQPPRPGAPPAQQPAHRRGAAPPSGGLDAGVGPAARPGGAGAGVGAGAGAHAAAGGGGGGQDPTQTPVHFQADPDDGKNAGQLGLHWRALSLLDVGQLFGTGIGLYFLFLRYFGIVCLLLSIPYVMSSIIDVIKTEHHPGFVCDYDTANNGFAYDALAAFTIGGTCGDDALQGLMDAVCTLLLLWFTFFYLPTKHENFDRMATATEVLCEDYTVYVRGIPRSASVQDIANFFSRYGTVLYVERPHENKELLTAARKLDVLKQKLSGKKGGCCSGRSRLQSRVDAAQGRVDRLRRQVWNPTSQAFVTFQYQYEADAAELKYSNIGLCDRFTNWGMCKRYPPKFNGNCIVVERAADPTNVLWEHLQFGTTNRVLRELVTTVAVLVLVGAASYATAYVKSPEAAEPGHIHENVFYKWGVPSFLATIPLSIITVAINAVIKKVYIHMAAWETHHHISGQEEWCMVKAAFGQYFNVVFVQWYMYGFPWTDPAHWYTTCVPNVISTVVVTAFSSTVVAAFLGARKAKKHEEERVKHQLLAESNFDENDAEERTKEALSGFQLSAQYSEALAIVFITLTYCSAVPILMPFLAVYLLGNYFVDKHHLIHLNASPPMLDERLAKWVEKVLPIGVCIHSVFGALSYTGDASVALMITMSCLSIGGLLFFECWESCKDEEPPQDINMAIPFQHFWMHAPFLHPLTVVHKIREASDRYVHPMVANQHTLMHVDGEDNTNQPHAYGRIPGARIKDRITRWRQMQEVVQRFPHLLEQRMFIVKLLNRDQPLGVVSLRVGRQWQCCYCPCSACTKTSAHPDLRHLRQAVYQSGLLNKPELQQYMHYSAGRPVPPDQVMQHMRFAVGGEGLPMEPGAQAGPFALCKCEEQTIYAIRYLPMVTLTWPGLMTRANRLQYVHREWVSDGDDRSLEWRPVGYESTRSSGSLLNVGERVPV